MKLAYGMKTEIVMMHIEKIRFFKLSRPIAFDYVDLRKIISAYNGIGPDRFPVLLRLLTSALCNRFAPAAVIHDYEYQQIIDHYRAGYITLSDARGLYRRADANFGDNCRRIVGRCFMPIDPRAWYYACLAKFFYWAVTHYGWRGVTQAILRGGR